MKTAVALAASLILAGCSAPKEPAGSATPAVKIPPAPDLYRIKLETSKGDVVIEVHKDWAPKGAERFWDLVHNGFYNDARFFRVVRNFVVQFGINGDPKIQQLWVTALLPDDPVKHSNKKGTITFATSGPNSRTTQVFFNLKDNARLDQSGFAPFGEVVEGLDVVEGLYFAYGDGPPRGNGPNQDMIQTQGNAYLERSYPRLDYIKKASVMQ